MSFSFEILARDGAARAGLLTTPHGTIETPAFMPVGTVASVKGVPQNLLEQLGVEILLGNTYHLSLRPGCELIRDLGGLHRFMSWDHPILTDSGGFQVFSLSPFRKVSEQGVEFRSHLDGSLRQFTPESSMAAQISLGADIAMAFDECTEYPASRERAQSSLQRTLRWALRSQQHFEQHKHEVPWHRARAALERVGSAGAAAPTKLREINPEATPSLFGIVQGGMYADLRREAAERIVEMNFPGYALGGLSVGEPRPLTRQIIGDALAYLPQGKPRYVMGVGYPEEISEYARMGVDMMDCVLPTRAARHGLLFTSSGRINIKNTRYAADSNPLDATCECQVCARYSRAYLRHLYVAGEPLAGVLNTLHNLAHYLDTMKAVRHSIRTGKPAADVSADAARETAEL